MRAVQHTGEEMRKSIDVTNQMRRSNDAHVYWLHKKRQKLVEFDGAAAAGDYNREDCE